MTDKHTPGNWFVDNGKWSKKLDPTNHTIMSAAGGVVARVVFDATDHSEADARLIAAAPDLLHALQDMLEASDVSVYEAGSVIGEVKEEARNAISKATN